MTEQLMNQQQATMDEFLEALKGKTEELLRGFFVGKRFEDAPWSDEHFEVTMQVVIDVTVANTDVTNFNVNTSVEDHLLLMTVEDDKENMIANVIYEITRDAGGYVIDDVHVAFKPGPFIALKEEQEMAATQLPF